MCQGDQSTSGLLENYQGHTKYSVSQKFLNISKTKKQIPKLGEYTPKQQKKTHVLDLKFEDVMCSRYDPSKYPCVVSLRERKWANFAQEVLI